MAGTIAAAAGASACTDCAAGTIAAAAASTVCVDWYGASFHIVLFACCIPTSYTLNLSFPPTSAIGTYSAAAGGTACTSCADYNEGEDNAYYYQNQAGQANCEACECNDKANGAVESCDILDGFCTCAALFVDTKSGEAGPAADVDCGEEQDVVEAMKFAYSFFGFFLLFVLPFIFSSGALAVMAGVWRKDVGIIIYKMREITQKAVQIKKRRRITAARREIDKRLINAFDSLDDDASGEIDEEELAQFFELIELELTEEEISKAMAAVDLDGNGVVDADVSEVLPPVLNPPFRKQR